MELVQFYETQIGDVQTGLLARFVVVPAAAFRPRMSSIGDLLAALELQSGEDVASPRLLSAALAATLESETLDRALGNFHSLLGARYVTSPEMERTPEGDRASQLLDFSDAAVFAEYIPFEASPLQAESLAALLSKAGARGGVAFGGSAAIVGAVSGHPLLVVFVAGGMVIGGAAKGLGKALEEGLYHKVLAALKVPDRRPSGGETEVSALGPEA